MKKALFESVSNSKRAYWFSLNEPRKVLFVLTIVTKVCELDFYFLRRLRIAPRREESVDARLKLLHGGVRVRDTFHPFFAEAPDHSSCDRGAVPVVSPTRQAHM